MLNDILIFFKREKFYTFLFLFLAALCAALWFFPHPKMKDLRSSSPALQEFRKAELRLQEKLEASGSLKIFLSQRPALSTFFRILSFVIAGAFSFGLLIDFSLLFNPKWRKGLGRPHPEKTPWKVSMLFKVILLFMTASFLLSLLLGWLRHSLDAGLSTNFYLLVHTTLADIFCLGFIFMVIGQEKGHWRDLGFRIPSPCPLPAKRGEGKGEGFFKEVLLGWGGYLAVLPAFAATLLMLITLARLFSYEPPAHPLVSVFLEEEERSPFLIFYSVTLATVLGPFFEEIFFRGFCYPILKKRYGVPWAMVLSAAFFAYIHDSSFAFWPIFILGLGLAYLYEKRRSLVAPTVLHITHNAVFIAYFFLAKTVIFREAGMGGGP